MEERVIITAMSKSAHSWVKGNLGSEHASFDPQSQM